MAGPRAPRQGDGVAAWAVAGVGLGAATGLAAAPDPAAAEPAAAALAPLARRVRFAFRSAALASRPGRAFRLQSLLPRFAFFASAAAGSLPRSGGAGLPAAFPGVELGGPPGVDRGPFAAAAGSEPAPDDPGPAFFFLPAAASSAISRSSSSISSSLIPSSAKDGIFGSLSLLIVRLALLPTVPKGHRFHWAPHRRSRGNPAR